MTDWLDRYPYLFPLFFAVIWLFATSMIALMSGWFELQSRYPDQPEAPLRSWSMVSGNLGGLAHYGGCLTLAVCPSGLRIGVWRVFGPFCRSFLVPWSELRTEPRGTGTRLVFGAATAGERAVGQLTVTNWQASQLAAAAGKSWPALDAQAVEPSPWAVAQRLALQWLLVSAAAALFFTLAPRLMAPHATSPPVAVAMLFPTLFFGAATIVQFVVYLAGRKPSRSGR